MKPRVSWSKTLDAVPHMRKCESCARFFLWTHDQAIVLADQHYHCPDCRKHPPIATDTVTMTHQGYSDKMTIGMRSIRRHGR